MAQNIESEPHELYTNTKTAILRLIAENMDQHVQRLPPEDELAQQLCVSRVLLRDIFAELELRGYITRKRGRGTVINRQICLAQPRIDEPVSFVQLFAAKGLSATVRLLDERWVGCGESDLPQDAELRQEQGALLLFERVICGDGMPIIYNKLYFKGNQLSSDYKNWKGYASLAPNRFLELFCGERVNVTLVEQNICAADSRLAGILEVAEGVPLLCMDDIRYDINGHELVREHSVFRAEILPLKLVQCQKGSSK